MTKKTKLPVLETEEPSRPAKKPSIEVARSRLGGKIDAGAPPSGLAPGRIVTFAMSSGSRRAAVVVYAGADEVHVLLDGVRLRRLQAEQLEMHDGAAPEELSKLAAEAQVFGLLVVGQPVRYADDTGSLVDGKLIEKCRWGALVARDDGAVVAVGFRKLWPAPATNGGTA